MAPPPTKGSAPIPSVDLGRTDPVSNPEDMQGKTPTGKKVAGTAGAKLTPKDSTESFDTENSQRKAEHVDDVQQQMQSGEQRASQSGNKLQKLLDPKGLLATSYRRKAECDQIKETMDVLKQALDHNGVDWTTDNAIDSFRDFSDQMKLQDPTLIVRITLPPYNVSLVPPDEDLSNISPSHLHQLVEIAFKLAQGLDVKKQSELIVSNNEEVINAEIKKIHSLVEPLDSGSKVDVLNELDKLKKPVVKVSVSWDELKVENWLTSLELLEYSEPLLPKDSELELSSGSSMPPSDIDSEVHQRNHRLVEQSREQFRRDRFREQFRRDRFNHVGKNLTERQREGMNEDLAKFDCISSEVLSRKQHVPEMQLPGSSHKSQQNSHSVRQKHSDSSEQTRPARKKMPPSSQTDADSLVEQMSGEETTENLQSHTVKKSQPGSVGSVTSSHVLPKEDVAEVQPTDVLDLGASSALRESSEESSGGRGDAEGKDSISVPVQEVQEVEAKKPSEAGVPEGRLLSFRLDYNYKRNTQGDARRQALAILEKAQEIIAKNPQIPGVAITYSANHDQTQKILSVYEAGGWQTGISGSNQANVMAEMEKLLGVKRFRKLQGKVRIAPISTMLHKGNNGEVTDAHVDLCLKILGNLIDAGWQLLGWQNQDSVKREDSPFAIGGGVGGSKFHSTNESKRIQDALVRLSKGDQSAIKTTIPPKSATVSSSSGSTSTMGAITTPENVSQPGTVLASGPGISASSEADGKDTVNQEEIAQEQNKIQYLQRIVEGRNQASHLWQDVATPQTCVIDALAAAGYSYDKLPETARQYFDGREWAQQLGPDELIQGIAPDEYDSFNVRKEPPKPPKIGNIEIVTRGDAGTLGVEIKKLGNASQQEKQELIEWLKITWLKNTYVKPVLALKSEGDSGHYTAWVPKLDCFITAGFDQIDNEIEQREGFEKNSKELLKSVTELTSAELKEMKTKVSGINDLVQPTGDYLNGINPDKNGVAEDLQPTLMLINLPEIMDPAEN